MQLATTARNAMANAFAGLFASGSSLRFETAGNAAVATLPLNATPFSSAPTGKVTANAITPDSSAAGGVIDHAIMRNASSATEATLSVGTSSGDIIITTLTIAAGASVSMSLLEFTMPAS